MAKIREAIEEFKPDPRVVDERGPTRQRAQHAGEELEVVDTGTQRVRDPLERLLKKPIRGTKKTVIDRDEYTAGIKFRHHWYHSGFAPSIGSSDLNRVFSGSVFGPSAKSEQQIFHRQQYKAACEKVGMRIERILSDVICWEKPLDEIGMAALGYSDRRPAEVAVKELFKTGLGLLVDLWGLKTK